MAITKNAITAGLLGLAFATPALAVDVNNTTFANFGQTVSNPLFNYNMVGNTNTIGLNGQTRFNILGLGPVGSYLTNTVLSASTTSAFFLNGLQFQQTGFAGSINFIGTEAGFVGTNFLTVNFSDATFSFDGDGSSGSLISTDPSSPISYSSDVLDVALFTSRDFGFNVTGSSPGFGVNSSGLGDPFVANLNGAFAGSGVVPEPASWAMLILGFGLTGVAARRRQRGMTAVTA